MKLKDDEVDGVGFDPKLEVDRVVDRLWGVYYFANKILDRVILEKQTDHLTLYINHLSYTVRCLEDRLTIMSEIKSNLEEKQ